MTIDQPAWGVLFDNGIDPPRLLTRHGDVPWLFVRRGDALALRGALEPHRGKGRVVKVLARYEVEDRP